MSDQLPRRILVAETLNSRYEPGTKPVSWDDRRDGVERVRTNDGEEISLYSSGGQASPSPGWELLLTQVHSEEQASIPSFHWTLYGVSSTDPAKAIH